MTTEEMLHSIVSDYLIKNGFLTKGFIGDGPVRVSFLQNDEKYEQGMVVGLRVTCSDPSLETEIVAVKVSDPESFEKDLIAVTHDATKVFANECFLALAADFDLEEKEVAAQMGVGLLQIEGTLVTEVVPAKFFKSRFIDFPKHKFDGLNLAQKWLGFSENDWGRLARVFCRAEEAFCGFNVGDVFVELEKNVVVLEVRISIRAGPLRKWGSYSFKFGELAGFLVNGNDDRYTFVEKLGNMFVFGPSEWNFMLNLLSKVDLCHLVFYIGTARVVFAKHPAQDGLDLKVDFVDGRDSEYEHHYSQVDLAKLTQQIKEEKNKDKA
jgi:hypothetical protein